MQSSAYGASLAGGAFDFAGFAKQPQTALRCLSWVSDDTRALAAATASCRRVDPDRREPPRAKEPPPPPPSPSWLRALLTVGSSWVSG